MPGAQILVGNEALAVSIFNEKNDGMFELANLTLKPFLGIQAASKSKIGYSGLAFNIEKSIVNIFYSYKLFNNRIIMRDRLSIAPPNSAHEEFTFNMPIYGQYIFRINQFAKIGFLYYIGVKSPIGHNVNINCTPQFQMNLKPFKVGIGYNESLMAGVTYTRHNTKYKMVVSNKQIEFACSNLQTRFGRLFAVGGLNIKQGNIDPYYKFRINLN